MDTLAFREEVKGLIADMRKAGVPHLAEELEDMVKVHLYRRPEISRGKVSSRRVTKKIKRRVWELWRAHPDWTQMDIAVETGIAASSVSKILNRRYE